MDLADPLIVGMGDRPKQRSRPRRTRLIHGEARSGAPPYMHAVSSSAGCVRPATERGWRLRHGVRHRWRPVQRRWWSHWHPRRTRWSAWLDVLRRLAASGHLVVTVSRRTKGFYAAGGVRCKTRGGSACAITPHPCCRAFPHQKLVAYTDSAAVTVLFHDVGERGPMSDEQKTTDSEIAELRANHKERDHWKWLLKFAPTGFVDRRSGRRGTRIDRKRRGIAEVVRQNP